MPVKDWKQHGRNLWAECEQAWNWLRALPEYRTDYLTMKKRPQRTYHIPQGSTILTAQPQPKDAFAESLKNKWGFYPLINPSKKISGTLFRTLINAFGISNTEAGVRHIGFGYLELLRPNGELRKHDLLALPERLTFSIDPHLPIEPILKYIGEHLKLVQRLYSIKSERRQAAWLSKEYQARTLRKLGKTEQEIRQFITPSHWDLKNEEDHRQVVARIRRKSKKAFK